MTATQAVTGTETEDIKTTTEEVKADTSVPPNANNPLQKIESGVLTIPQVDGWDETEPQYYTDLNEFIIDWASEQQVPGYEESEKTLLSLEYTNFCPNESFESGFVLTLYPFDEDGNPLVSGMSQERITVGTYKSLRIALKNAKNVLESLTNLEKSDEIVLNGKIFTL